MLDEAMVAQIAEETRTMEQATAWLEGVMTEMAAAPPGVYRDVAATHAAALAQALTSSLLALREARDVRNRLAYELVALTAAMNDHLGVRVTG